MRVVSLVPSLTETLLAFGVQPVACTRFCEQPTLPHVGGTKDPDIEAIVALHPDLVLMDREENRLPDAEALQAQGVEVHATHVTSVADVAPMMQALVARLGLPAAPDLATEHDEDVDRALRVAERTAFVAIWRRPWMTISGATYGSSLLESIGIANVFADAATAYPTVMLAEVVERAPQLVLLPSEPYPFKQRHMKEIATALPEAVIRLVDGQDLFWWGARTSAARRRLAQILSGSPS